MVPRCPGMAEFQGPTAYCAWCKGVGSKHQGVRIFEICSPRTSPHPPNFITLSWELIVITLSWELIVMFCQWAAACRLWPLVCGQGGHVTPSTTRAAANTKPARFDMPFCTLHTLSSTPRLAGAAHHCGASRRRPAQTSGLGLMVHGQYKYSTPRSGLILMQRTVRCISISLFLKPCAVQATNLVDDRTEALWCVLHVVSTAATAWLGCEAVQFCGPFDLTPEIGRVWPPGPAVDMA